MAVRALGNKRPLLGSGGMLPVVAVKTCNGGFMTGPGLPDLLNKSHMTFLAVVVTQDYFFGSYRWPYKTGQCDAEQAYNSTQK